ncbi:MAG: AAA family ATPase [Deltaproteobacteria bacterium]|nr:AAA family ATPase [Deltaproteobacteria bacterium]
MLPTKKTPPKKSLSDLSILCYGRTKAGKCLAPDTTVINASNSRPITIQEMVENKEGSVLTMKEAGRLVAQEPSTFFENKPQQLYRMRTQTGRVIEATANHPFLTREGWKPLSDLNESNRVAVVAEYPRLDQTCKTDAELLKILAYLIADGSLGKNTSPVFTKNDPEVRLDFENAVEKKGDECIEFTNDRGIIHVRVRGKQGARNNVIRFLKEVGLHGLRSGDKFIPNFVYALSSSKLALFLNRLFTCDGSVEASGRISYSSKSIRLVQQVQHLLLRFGIVSIIRDRYLNGELYGAELTINAKPDVLKFIDEIGVIGKKAVIAENIRRSLYDIRANPTQLDRIGPILFDRIKSIEPTRVAPTYDLCVDGSHNFVANDFIVHNSTWCSHAPDALFLATEPGLNHLDVYQMPINSWEDLLAACAEIATGEHQFKTVIIDTVDNTYRFCVEYTCKKYKIEHESDLGYGKGYSLVNNEFQRVLLKLAFLPYGFVLVSHSQEQEIETRTGKQTRIVPTLPKQARKFVLGLVDMVLYCDQDVSRDADGKPRFRRIMRTKPHPNFEAGDRTGRLPEVIDLDFGKFIRAFNAAPNTNPNTNEETQAVA